MSHKTFTYHEASTVVGTVVITEEDSDTWYINSVTVNPSHRRRGIAGFLMGQVCRWADMEGKSLTLFACSIHGPGPRPHTEELERWYERLGFEEECDDGHMRRYPRDTERETRAGDEPLGQRAAAGQHPRT